MIATVPSYVNETIKEKIDRILPAVQKNMPCGEEPDVLFVSFSPTEGVTNLSVWLFSENLVVEIRNPHLDGRIQHDLGPIKKAVDWMRLDARDFDFQEQVNAGSQLKLEFTTKDGLSGELFAKGEESCRDLMNLYRNKFLPNFLWILGRNDD